MKSLKLFLRLSWRHAWRRPLQSLFFVAGVAIGVAMIVAIDLANSSAQRAFELGTESVAGRATHQILGGPTGLNQSVYTDLRRDLDYRLSAPVVEAYVTALEMDAQPMRLLGVDPFAESPFRSYLGTREGTGGPGTDYLSALLTRPDAVLISSDVAARYGLDVGDTTDVRIGGDVVPLTIVGLLEPSDELSRRALSSLLIADIATAQELLDSVGRLSRIDLIVPEADAPTTLASIESILPPGVRVQQSAARDGTVNDMTAAFQLNLTALSLLALVVGMFLIYNTVTFSVVQRRPVLGSLRALGMTGREVFALILGEAGLLGVLGTVLGLGLGILLGAGAVRLVTQTINDLFFVVAVREMDIPIFTLVKGAVIGICAALFGATIPAIEATNVAPTGAMQRSNIEERTLSALPWISGAGVLLLALGAALLLPEWNLIITFIGLFVVILGCALLTPVLTLWIIRLVQRGADRVAGVIERMAPRTIIRSLSRTSVAVAALMVAVSVIIGVGVMIGSFRSTVELWLEDVLQADIFISPPSLTTTNVSSTLEPQLIEQLRTFDGVESLATTRSADVAAYLDEAGEAGENGEPTQVRLAAVSQDLAGADRRYRSAIGDWQETWRAVESGSVLINEPMATRTGLSTGDTLTLLTDQGPQGFPIAGVYTDFDVNSVVFMADATYREWWDDAAISALALFVEPGTDVDTVVSNMQRALAGQTELLVRSNRGMRLNALEVFDRTFAITVALQILATIVAFIGILSTLMSLQLERRREIGVLRANGMTRRQLWRMTMWETGLIGSSAGLLAMPTGILLALILIYIINLRSFGWTLTLQLRPEYFAQAFAVALGAALLAGIYPAWRTGQMHPATAVRAE